MSDSYSAWCEQNERNFRLFTNENINAVKSTKEFQTALKKAKEASKGAKFCRAKSCENCAYNHYLNGKSTCAKLSIILYGDHFVCSRWKKNDFENMKVYSPKFIEDIIAWSILWKNRFEFDK